MAADTCNRWVYPKVRQDASVVEELTEDKISIADPYRYLEDPDSEETVAFVDSQNRITRPYLDSIPEREKFHARMTELYNYQKYSTPYKRGSRYFYHHNSGLQNQLSKVCVPCSLGVEVEEYFKVSHRLRSTSSSTSTPREYVTHTLLLSREHNSHQQQKGVHSPGDLLTICLGTAQFTVNPLLLDKDTAHVTCKCGSGESVLYVQDSLEEQARVFFDPNTLSEDGTVALGTSSFSEDGEWFAYELSESGSDWRTVQVMKVSSGEKLSTVLKKVKFSSIAWTHDNKGFFYQCYPKADDSADGTETNQNKNHKTYYHRVGTTQEEDVLCCEFLEEPDWLLSTEVSDCGNYVILYVNRGAEPKNLLYYCDLRELPDGGDIKGKLHWTKIVDQFDASYDYITNQGNQFILQTNYKAPNYCLVMVDLSKPEREHWLPLVAEHEKDVLEWTACVNGDRLVLCYLQDVKNVLQMFNTEGIFLRDFPLAVGTVTGYSGRKKDSEMFYSFASFLTPGIIYRVDLSKEVIQPKIFREIVVNGFDSSGYETKQVFYSSKDGTKVPMFVVHRKGIALDGSHPTLMYGYGGFNISLTPYFSTSRVIFMQHMGGVFAIPNIRGGGEYGERWHEMGIMNKKQNVFDDFQAAAEFLIENKYTTPQRLAIMGGSNGGLLVCACANQRPDLFKCVVSQVGVLDMLRFHKFTIGHAWVTDFGNPDKTADFKWIFKYSPLHNIPNSGEYPAILVLTADHDDRVVPLHSLKFIATLQCKLGGSSAQINPLLARIETKAGHGAGKPTSKVIDETADMYAFIAANLGTEWQL